MEEEYNFPRGRAEPIEKPSSTENQKSKQESKKQGRKRSKSNDFLFTTHQDDAQGGSKKSKKQKKNASESIANTTIATSTLPLGGGAVMPPIESSSHKKPAFIESLSFQKVAKGMKMLGVVRQVAPEYAVVSLPSMFTGFIRRDSNSGIRLDHVVSVGMVLPVAVLRATSETVSDNGSKSKTSVKRRIELTVSPAILNNGLNHDMLYEGITVRGRIRSVEDHGCLVDLNISGMRSKTCFLKYENIEGEYEVLDTSDEVVGVNENENKVILNKGRVYDFRIHSIPKSNDGTLSIIQLKLQSSQTRSKQVIDPFICMSSKHTIRSLSPGMLFDVDVEHFARNGLCVTFMGSVYRGAIDSSSLGGFLPEGYKNLKEKNSSDMWWKSVFVGKLRKIKARLIAVDSVSKIIRLSIQPHILSMSVPKDEFPKVGAIIENARVVRLDPGVGALLALPSDKEASSMDIEDTGKTNNLLSNPVYASASEVKCAYVHISKAIDSDNHRTPEALFGKRFALNNKIPKLRIISNNNWMDNIVSCATAESIVSSAVLSHTDLNPGAIYRDVPVIANLESGGVLVQLGVGVKGLIPAMHLFDKSVASENGNSYRNKVRMEKYKEGNKIDVRCLVISPNERKCILTAKKGLISSDLDNPITEYSGIEKGRTATGFISRVSKQGIAITFYNNVFGRISARKLAEEMGVENPIVDFKVGDIVKVKVRQCLKKRARETVDDDDEDETRDTTILDLSMNLFSSAEENEKVYTDDNAFISLIKPGMILKSKCMKIVELVPSKKRQDNNSFLPGHAVLSIKCKHLSSFKDSKDAKGSVTCKLPFEHILDSHDVDTLKTPSSMDALAMKILTVGKKIAQEAVVLSTSNRHGNVSTPIVSLKPNLVETARTTSSASKNQIDVLLPKPSTSLFLGAYVRGYCVRLDPRYGAFIRFLDNLTAIVPKLKGGLDIGLYDTVLCKIVVMDVTSGTPKILLKHVQSLPTHTPKNKKQKETGKNNIADELHPGDVVGDVKVDEMNFARAAVTILDKKFKGSTVKARIHMTMANPLKGPTITMPIHDNATLEPDDDKEKITKYHPLYTWKVGSIVRDVRCVAIDVREGITYVELTNREVNENKLDIPSPLFVDSPSSLSENTIVSAVITSIANQNKGLWVQICPGISGFVPGLELCNDIQTLNNLKTHFMIGGKITCCVVGNKAEKGQFKRGVRLSVLEMERKKGKEKKTGKPIRGNIIIGRVNRYIKQQRSPALMIELPGGYLGRCDITELDEIDDWGNMPLGRLEVEDDTEKNDNDELDERDHHLAGDYKHGLYVQCRVLASSGGAKGTLEVSLRESRIEGDLDDDDHPEEKQIVQAYVVSTTRKGCFLRLSRFVEGRTILKELSDSFLPDPASMFPPGRLVVGKVKKVQTSNNNSKKKGKSRITIDLDMRESVLLDDQNKLAFEDIKQGEIYRGIVTRIESYGVFVRLENSQVSGLVHLSECSDEYVKNLASLYDPGDLVKTLVIKVEKEEKRIGLSMKASHFEDDDSDDDSDIVSEDDSDDEDILMTEAINANDIDSDDDNFVSKLANKIRNTKGTSDDDSDDGNKSSGSSSSEEDSDDDSEEVEEGPTVMDTNVGFDWGKKSTEIQDEADSDSSDDADSDEEEEEDVKTGHKSRKKALAKRLEEKEISKMEQRIADGTADENPETSADFERLIASDPNASENWIKYMAYHLSLADIESARSTANRAFERIEFRQEGEKLNVWTALITLESKYGTQNSLNETIDRASQHNNPKQVYLRVCEMMERDVEKSHGDLAAIKKADEMFAKMCKKFKSKKTVWIAYFKYLLKNGRHDEAHQLWKKSVTSLPSYKHIESMSKFAQLEYEYGSAARARTIFDALIDKHRKRMDLLFVYVDKEIKHGDVHVARRLFEKTINPTSGQNKTKYNDKQMKSLFKKWYRMEEDHGDEDSKLRVKIAAKEYVAKSSS